MSIRGQKETLINLINHKAEDRVQKYQNQKELNEIIYRKNAEISILHQVNTRLGEEVFRLQKKLGIDQDAILKNLQQIDEISVAFHIETKQLQYLDALLISYDENNIKQKKLIAHLYNALEDSEKKTENIINDNQFLLKQLQQKCQQILQIYSKGFPEENLVQAYTKLQRQSELQLIESVRQQNEYILRHFQAADIKISKLNEELKQTKIHSDQYFSNYKSQSQQLSDSLVQLDDLIKIKEVLQKKLGEVTQDNVQLQTSREQLQTKVSKLQGELKLIRNQYQSYRKSTRQQIQRVNDEFESLKSENESSEKRQRDLFNKNLLLEKQIQSLKDQYRSCKIELQKNKADFEQTLKMCEVYEQKIRNINKKESLMKETVQQCKQRLDNMILEKQKAQLKQKQLQKLIQNINSKNREELQTLKKNHQKIACCQNQKIRFLEEEREDMLSAHHQNQCSLKHQCEKLKKQNSMLKQENQKHINHFRNQSGGEILSKIKDLQEKNQQLSSLLSQKERNFHQDIDHKDQMLRNLENENRDLNRQIDRERASSRQAINERTQLKSKISIIQKQKDCLEEQISKLKRNLDNRISNQSEIKLGRIRQLEEKLRQAEKENKQIKKKTMQMLEKYDEAEEEIKKQFQNQINKLASENSKLKLKLKK